MSRNPQEAIKKLEKTISILLAAVIALYAGLSILLSIPSVQSALTEKAADILSRTLQTEVRLGGVRADLLTGKISLDSLTVRSQTGGPLLSVGRLSTRCDLMPLLSRGRLVFSTVQLLSPEVHLTRDSLGMSNLDFILDMLTPRQDSLEYPFSLRINSLLIRRGHLSISNPAAGKGLGRLDLSLMNLDQVRGNISIKALSRDTLNIAIRQLSFQERQSGLNLDHLGFFLKGNRNLMTLSRLEAVIGSSRVKVDTLSLHPADRMTASESLLCSGFRMDSLKADLRPEDLAPLVGRLGKADLPLHVEAVASGTLDSLRLSHLLATSPEGHLRLEASGLLGGILRGNTDGLSADIRTLFMDREALMQAGRVAGLRDGLLERLDHVSLASQVEGPASRLHLTGRIETGAGTILPDLTAGLTAGGGELRGTAVARSLDAGAITGNRDLGRMDLTLSIEGRFPRLSAPSVRLQAHVDSAMFRGYAYHDLSLEGSLSEGIVRGWAELDDRNAGIRLDLEARPWPRDLMLRLRADVRELRIHDVGLSSRNLDQALSLTLTTDLRGKDLSSLEGTVRVDSLLLRTPSRDYTMDQMTIQSATSSPLEHQITLTSDWIRGSLKGRMDPKSIRQDAMDLISRHLPSLSRSVTERGGGQDAQAPTRNDLRAEVTVLDTDLLGALTGQPVELFGQASLTGYFRGGHNGQVRLSGYCPRLRYGTRFMESVSLNAGNGPDGLDASLQASELSKDGALSCGLALRASRDSLEARLSWGNDQNRTYSGEVSAMVSLMRSPSEIGAEAGKEALAAVFHVRPTRVIVSDTVWSIQASEMVLRNARLTVRDFRFSGRDGEGASVQGSVSGNPSDTLWINLKGMNIQYLSDLADLGIGLRGEATGRAWATGLTGIPEIRADLSVKDFGIFDSIVGDAIIRGSWDHGDRGIRLAADIDEAERYHTHVDGIIRPLSPQKSLDLGIRAQGTSLDFLGSHLASVTPNLRGRAWGDVRIMGKFKSLDLTGKVDAEASMRIEPLGLTYSFRDSLTVSPQGLRFDSGRLIDQEGHEGRLMGRILWDHLRNVRYSLDFTLDNSMVFNRKKSLSLPFYGKVLATGSAHLEGNPQEMDLQATLTTGRGSSLVYIKDATSTASAKEFITFTDITPRRATPMVRPSEFERARIQTTEEAVRRSSQDVRMELMLSLNDDLSMQVLMDQASGDRINAKGSGSIRADYYNKGSLGMYGTYYLNSGVYRTSFQEVIRKDLQIQDGSSITFNGNPLEGELNLSTLYQVNSASLNDLIPDAGSYVDQTSVRVNCLMDITGTLSTPKVSMSLELPLEREEVQSLVKNYIPTDDQMQMQILYLLGIGKFYTPNYVNITRNSDVMSSIVSSTLSGQLNSALTSLINSTDWNFGTNFSTGQKGWTDMEFEGMLSGALLNNRLLINGNFGYREDQMRGNTNFVGDFDAQLLLTRNGNIRLKAFNETNDRYYTRTNLTTQGVGIVFKNDFNRWKDLMFWKIRSEGTGRDRSGSEDRKQEDGGNALQMAPAPSGQEEETDPGARQE